jgi:hypothetical protein
MSNLVIFFICVYVINLIVVTLVVRHTIKEEILIGHEFRITIGYALKFFLAILFAPITLLMFIAYVFMCISDAVNDKIEYSDSKVLNFTLFKFTR